MNALEFPPHAPLYILGVITLPLASLSAWRQRSVPGARGFAIMFLFMSWWTFCTLIEHSTNTFEQKLFWSQAQYIATATAPTMWLMFCIDYARPGAPRDRRLLLLWVIPIVSVFVAWTNSLHGLMWADIRPIPGLDGYAVVYDHGTWFWVMTLHNYPLVLCGLILLLNSARRLFAHQRIQSIVLVIVTIIVIGSNVLYLAGFSLIPYADSTPLSFGLVGVILFFAMFNRGFFDLVASAQNIAFENMREGLLHIDAAGMVAMINRALGELLGADARNLLKTPAVSALAVSPDLLHVYESNTQQATVRLPGPPARIVEVKQTPLDRKTTGAAGRLLLLRDVTQRQSDQAHALAVETEQARVNVLTSFVHAASHAFRSPLSSINVSLFVAQKSDAPDVRAKQFDLIDVQVNRLSNLLDAILLLASLDTGQPLPMEPVEPRNLLSDLAESVASSLRDKQLSLSLAIEPDLPVISANADKLSLALRNVLLNAIQFTAEGGSVTLGATSDESGLLVTITDTGYGMSERVLAHVMERFYRAERSADQGFGLGLPIAHRIIQHHGGTITLESEPGVGTTVRVRLPPAESAQQADSLHLKAG
jgi:signal transduction histidine kinase